MFTSDEEEEEDLPTPRLQSIPEIELFSSSQWGAISAGQDSSTVERDVDEMSEMSAVFPPDIGRFRYQGEVGGPLAMALAGIPEGDSRPQRSSSFRSKLRKKGKEDGLLQKLKKKATA
jgi:hypothetical protein